MATLNSSLNTIACGVTGTDGFGLQGCLVRMRKAKKALFTSAGYEFDGTQDFTDAYIASLVAAGTVIAVDYINSVEDQSSQNSYEDLGEGREALDVVGLYKFKLNFIKGMARHSALSKLNGDGKYDISYVDNEGTLMGTKAASGNLKGFLLGVHQTELISGMFEKNVPTESFIVQHINTTEMENYAVKTRDESFDGRNIPSINEVVLSFGAVPANTDTDITVVAKLKQDNSVFTGAVATQWAITVDGSAANPTGGDDSTTAGTYVLTGVTAITTDDIVTVDLYDVSGSKIAVLVGSFYYKSETITETAVV